MGNRIGEFCERLGITQQELADAVNKSIRQDDEKGYKLQNRVAEYRKKRGLTQEELAELSGVSVSTIREIEHGKQKFKVSISLKISAALEAEHEELFYIG